MTQQEQDINHFQTAIEWVLNRPCSNTEFKAMAADIQTTVDLLVEKLELMGIEVWNDGEKTWFLESNLCDLQANSIFPLICAYIHKKERVPA